MEQSDNVTTVPEMFQQMIALLQPISKDVEELKIQQADSNSKIDKLSERIGKLEDDITGKQFMQATNAGINITYIPMNEENFIYYNQEVIIEVDEIFTVFDAKDIEFKLLKGFNSESTQANAIVVRIRSDQLGKSSNPSEVKMGDVLSIRVYEAVSVNLGDFIRTDKLDHIDTDSIQRLVNDDDLLNVLLTSDIKLCFRDPSVRINLLEKQNKELVNKINKLNDIPDVNTRRTGSLLDRPSLPEPKARERRDSTLAHKKFTAAAQIQDEQPDELDGIYLPILRERSTLNHSGILDKTTLMQIFAVIDETHPLISGSHKTLKNKQILHKAILAAKITYCANATGLAGKPISAKDVDWLTKKWLEEDSNSSSKSLAESHGLQIQQRASDQEIQVFKISGNDSYLYACSEYSILAWLQRFKAWQEKSEHLQIELHRVIDPEFMAQLIAANLERPNNDRLRTKWLQAQSKEAHDLTYENILDGWLFMIRPRSSMEFLTILQRAIFAKHRNQKPLSDKQQQSLHQTHLFATVMREAQNHIEFFGDIFRALIKYLQPLEIPTLIHKGGNRVNDTIAPYCILDVFLETTWLHPYFRHIVGQRLPENIRAKLGSMDSDFDIFMLISSIREVLAIDNSTSIKSQELSTHYLHPLTSAYAKYFDATTINRIAPNCRLPYGYPCKENNYGSNVPRLFVPTPAPNANLPRPPYPPRLPPPPQRVSHLSSGFANNIPNSLFDTHPQFAPTAEDVYHDNFASYGAYLDQYDQARPLDVDHTFHSMRYGHMTPSDIARTLPPEVLAHVVQQQLQKASTSDPSLSAFQQKDFSSYHKQSSTAPQAPRPPGPPQICQNLLTYSECTVPNCPKEHDPAKVAKIFEARAKHFSVKPSTLHHLQGRGPEEDQGFASAQNSQNDPEIFTNFIPEAINDLEAYEGLITRFSTMDNEQQQQIFAHVQHVLNDRAADLMYTNGQLVFDTGRQR